MAKPAGLDPHKFLQANPKLVGHWLGIKIDFLAQVQMPASPLDISTIGTDPFYGRF
jgi:hypothetical protein